MSKWRDQALALAGIFQFATLVERLAKTGTAPQSQLETGVYSLFQQNPESAEAVFGGADKLLPGLKAARQLLQSRQHPEYTDCLRYVLSILYLQRQLAKKRELLSIIGSRLEKARIQAEHFSLTHENVFSNLAGIYSDTLSTFRFRIQVLGDFNYLQQQRIANQIRAMLFAGVRAATLWRQLGGSRLHLLFQRKKLLTATNALITQIESSISQSGDTL
ncbi:high frequency lysogenization protein HflD [Microbulbifer thermotolerans]|uniref:High frequency lysogenization protein HflD homolog n=1 Tax=Microbulbifer thermotolerans TaxID=252514 RepID=A0A143HLX5_MICTH|nr:high frequency lysogenization protein HflD [Microbulbifer thermotolerans]AMX02531.1 DNA repair protein [Microbulbifer thermotolerans]MCX2779389.1 high frequency lysogenization protein HflD [Microbulbifer thermotolerans]MCX2782407.1 high frequency lysogenization protein HflD [Microbulbifer thermotolerans]MCX2794992.1 high frequency lysogenization protein HflD [Microbulbifer thermotolerans]MCX2800560.1 high frequency lysogenization protein HflD [Microbulbifer thermotolerans]